MDAPILSDNEKFDLISDRRISMYDVTKVDELVLVNPNLNFYGGVPKQTAFKMVELINKAERVIVYITDPKLMPKQLEQDRKIPGSKKALDKLCNCEYLYNYQTDFLKFYYANKDIPLLDNKKKQFDVVYFGNRRDSKRQEQLATYLDTIERSKVLIVGYEHEYYEWLPYNKNMWPLINKAYATPIIGDEKIHYSKSQITTRCYEPWFTTTIGLVSHRFGFPYPKELITSPDTFMDDVERVKRNHTKYINLQRKMLAELKSEFKNIKFDLTKMKQIKK
jgi:hypothetical protein